MTCPTTRMVCHIMQFNICIILLSYMLYIERVNWYTLSYNVDSNELIINLMAKGCTYLHRKLNLIYGNVSNVMELIYNAVYVDLIMPTYSIVGQSCSIKINCNYVRKHAK